MTIEVAPPFVNSDASLRAKVMFKMRFWEPNDQPAHQILTELFGYTRYVELQEHEAEIRHALELLDGPDGHTIYKIMRARCGKLNCS